MKAEDIVTLYQGDVISRSEARELAGIEKKEPGVQLGTAYLTIDDQRIDEVLEPVTVTQYVRKRFTKSEVEEMTTKEFSENRAAILKQLADDGKALTITKDSSVYETLTAVLNRLED